jgi:hypothetical protein
MTTTPARGFVALLRLPYWMMTGGLALLTSFAITKGDLTPEIALLTFFSMAFITSAGFSLNDYFDRETKTPHTFGSIVAEAGCSPLGSFVRRGSEPCSFDKSAQPHNSAN